MAKKKTGKDHPSQAWTFYDKGQKKNGSCPKCGAGVFLSQHKDRVYCGKCHYTEFSKK